MPRAASGTPPEQAAAVFEPYVQFENRLTRPEKGTGLGMAISRELARGMGGNLAVEGRPAPAPSSCSPSPPPGPGAA